MSTEAESWAPQACTLPTEQRPLRVAEFDALFSDAVTSVRRGDAMSVSMDLLPSAEVAAQAASLALRETGCCSFFTFSLVATGGSLYLEIRVPEEHVDVLDALAVWAEELSS
ncbi:hypothetical protein ACWEIJ_44175 [Lentzea sp. NPDC004789]